MKMKIAIDMDDVMADAGGALAARYNREHDVQISIHSGDGLSFHEILEDKDHEVLRSYLYEPGFFRHLPVIEGAKEVVPKLVEKYDVYIVSAAQEFPLSLTEKAIWLDEHFPVIHWTKRIFCGQKDIIAADVLIDDHAKNLEVFPGKPFVFTAFHNLREHRFQRLDNWEAVEREFL